MSVLDRDIIFWLNQPPRVEKGAYNNVSRKVHGETYYICSHDFPAERKQSNWDDGNYGKAKVVFLPKDKNGRMAVISSLLKNSDNKVHIVCGLRGSMADIICPILKKRHIKFCVVSERPNIVYTNIKGIYQRIGVEILHRIKRIRYENSVIAFLALGKRGLEKFGKLGWPAEKLYEFMYCGEYNENTQVVRERNSKTSLHFVYIGRFDFRTHAVNILMKAFDNLNMYSWRLDMAGGYGEKKDEVMEWIKNHSNIKYIGRINANDVGKRMLEYDVVLVPSRSEGWNCQINEALYAGIPIITTTEAVSDELVSKSGAGIVVKGADAKAYEDAIKSVINDPSLVTQWQKSAYKYRNKISAETVGEYLIGILNYAYGYSTGTRPICPW